MLKKGMWALLALVLAFVVYDFVTGLNQEQQVREQAGIQVQDSMEEETVDLTDEEAEALLENLDSGSLNTEVESGVEYGLRAGNTAYDFELEDREGNTVRLSDFRGQKVFLNFWASWCPPCRVEMPHLQEFHEENEDVVVLGVNVMSSESHPENAGTFIDELGLTFPNVYGVDDIVDLFLVESLPTSYFIGTDGTVYERVVGPVTKDILEARFSMID
ncbi:MAG: TlpA family protein disulfide reductase [Alkalibacterium sp.]|nr:TlpA family protein disulfide reductase [Alkalibacterium sp.]